MFCLKACHVDWLQTIRMDIIAGDAHPGNGAMHAKLLPNPRLDWHWLLEISNKRFSVVCLWKFKFLELPDL